MLTKNALFDLTWPGDLQRESGRFARIDSHEKPYFHNVRAIRANRLKPAIRNFVAPQSSIPKKGFQFGNHETIRENQANRFVQIGPSKSQVQAD